MADRKSSPFGMGIPPGKIAVLGLAWYEEADYPEIRRIMADRDRLPATWQEWRSRFEQQTQGFENGSTRVVRAIIKPKEFVGWCALRGLKLDSKARTTFASEYAARYAGTL